MKETKLYAKLRPHLLSWGECDRVENIVGSGMSDVFYNIGGRTGWIETKVAKGDTVYFEKFQPQWLGKHARLGARIYVMILDKNEAIHLCHANVILKLPRTPVGKWTTVSMNDLPKGFSMEPPYRSWNMVRDLLISS